MTIEQVEEGTQFAPKFDQDGLIPCVTTSDKNGEVLMLGYMNSEALTKTIVTGEAHYWSRSRKVLWHKGANSGLVQHIVELRVDDYLAARIRGWQWRELPCRLSILFLSKSVGGRTR